VGEARQTPRMGPDILGSGGGPPKAAAAGATFYRGHTHARADSKTLTGKQTHRDTHAQARKGGKTGADRGGGSGWNALESDAGTLVGGVVVDVVTQHTNKTRWRKQRRRLA
jgi:hypothetical protein